MPVRLGEHRDREEESVDGGVVDPPVTDLPDDAIVVDLTKDEMSQDWLDHTSEDDPTPKFMDLSEEEIQAKIIEVTGKIAENTDEES